MRYCIHAYTDRLAVTIITRDPLTALASLGDWYSTVTVEEMPCPRIA